jgi:hypothetical protein
MPRTIDNTTKLESKKNTLQSVALVEILHTVAPIRLHTGIGDLVYNSNTFQGIGTLGRISSIGENSSMASTSIDLSLSGIDTNLINTFNRKDIQNSNVTIWHGYLDDSTGALLVPVIVFNGFVNNTSVDIGKETSVINVNVIDEFTRWQKNLPKRYNNESQTSDYPNDILFSRQTEMLQETITWGGVPDVNKI